jgi:hypothetical protein
MGRFRANLAKSPQDKELQRHIYEAQRSLTKAIEVCEQVLHKNRREGSGSNLRPSSIKRDLSQLVARLNQIRRIHPLVTEPQEVARKQPRKFERREQ